MFPLLKDFLFFFNLALQPISEPGPPHSRGLEIVHNDAAQSVGLLWTSDQPVVEISTWQHTTLTTDETSMLPVGFEPTISAGERTQTYAFDRAGAGTGLRDCQPTYFAVVCVTEWESESHPGFYGWRLSYSQWGTGCGRKVAEFWLKKQFSIEHVKQHSTNRWRRSGGWNEWWLCSTIKKLSTEKTVEFRVNNSAVTVSVK